MRGVLTLIHIDVDKALPSVRFLNQQISDLLHLVGTF